MVTRGLQKASPCVCETIRSVLVFSPVSTDGTECVEGRDFVKIYHPFTHPQDLRLGKILPAHP